jgi:hypothetical protein
VANIFSYTDNLRRYYVKVIDEINSNFNVKLEKNNSKFDENYATIFFCIIVQQVNT